MVQRQTQEFNLQLGNSPAIQQSGTGMASPNVAKFQKAPVSVSDNTAVNSVLGVLAKGTQQLGQQYMYRQLEEAYMRGAAAVNNAEAKAALGSNPLTADWETAGFRDTAAKIQAANLDASIITEMPVLRTLEPDQFQQHLTKLRDEFAPALEGMSFEQRKVMLGQRMASERAATAKYMGARTEYIREETQLGYNSGANQNARALKTVRGNLAEYQALAMKSIVDTPMAVLADPRLRREDKQAMLEEFVLLHLTPENNNLAIYEMMSNGFTAPDGTKVPPLLDVLPQSKRDDLSRKYMTAKEDVKGLAFEQWYTAHGKITSDFDNLNAPLPTEDEYRAFLREGLENRLIKDTQSEMNRFYDAQRKRETTSLASSRYLAGDNQGNRDYGIDPDEALKATEEQLRLRMPGDAAGQVRVLMTAGVQAGQTNAFKAVGRRVDEAISTLGTHKDSTVSPQAAALVDSVIQTVQSAKADARADILINLKSGMSPENSEKLESYLAALRRNPDPQQAWRIAADDIMEKRKLSKSQLASDAALLASENRKLVNNLDATRMTGLDFGFGIVEQLPGVGLPFRGSMATYDTSRFVAPWAASKLKAEFEASIRGEYKVALQRVTDRHPDWKAETRDLEARADMQRRTIKTANGPLFVPEGTTIHQFIGVDSKDYTSERIGQAIDRLYPAPKEGAITWKVDTFGDIVGTQFDSRGEDTGIRVNLKPADVAGKLKDLDAERVAQSRAVYGSGTAAKAKNGTAVTFNGKNTAGVPAAAMFQFRSEFLPTIDLDIKPSKDMTPDLAYKQITDAHGKQAMQLVRAVGLSANTTATVDLIHLVSNQNSANKDRVRKSKWYAELGERHKAQIDSLLK